MQSSLTGQLQPDLQPDLQPGAVDFDRPLSNVTLSDARGLLGCAQLNVELYPIRMLPANLADVLRLEGCVLCLSNRFAPTGYA